MPADVCRCAPSLAHRLPVYDLDALLIEAELLLDWYLPASRPGCRPKTRARSTSSQLWHEALQAGAAMAPPTWVLRDFHSPNLIWLPEPARASPASACSISRMH